MQTYTVSFFGHREISNALAVEQRLDALVRTLLREREYVVFLLGRDGEFDQLAASTVRRCKRTVRDDNSALVWVLPYPTATLRENENAFCAYYDEIEICADSAGQHYKNAHQTRNRAMVDRSDLCIFCVQHPSGGAWQTMHYAEKCGIPCINIGIASAT